MPTRTTTAIMIIEMKDTSGWKKGVGLRGLPAFGFDVVDDAFGLRGNLLFDREGLDRLGAIDGLGEPADEAAVGVAGGPPFL
jgi:hypothetical protein